MLRTYYSNIILYVLILKMGIRQINNLNMLYYK